MKIIDIATWDRKETFEFYKNLDHPMYQMTFNLDVTHFYEVIKAHKKSFYFSFMYLSMREMNKIDAFKLRFHQNQVVLYDLIHPSFTDNIEGTERFKIVTVDYQDDWVSFVEHAKQVSLAQGELFIDLSKEERDDLVYVTTFPWASFTQVTFAFNHNSKDAIPRLTWGKFEVINQRKIMALGIGVHHAFVDGIHVGQFINHLQDALNQI